jgi:hypothetical protein
MKPKLRYSLEESLLDLELIRQTLCSYNTKHNESCDCKFGLKHVYPDKPHSLNFNIPRLPRGERGCGCAELRFIIGRLNAIRIRYEEHKKKCKVCAEWESRSCNSMEDVISLIGECSKCKEGNFLRSVIW